MHFYKDDAIIPPQKGIFAWTQVKYILTSPREMMQEIVIGIE